MDLWLGTRDAAGITVDMAAVFETFVREALRRALRLAPVQFPDGDAPPEVHLDERGKVRLKPDLRWADGDVVRFVGDAKYKIDTSGTGRNPDVYQLHAYAAAHGLPAATLVYADGPESTTLNVVGNGPAIHVDHLDLSQEPHQVLQQIDRLAARITSDVRTRLGA